MPVVIDDGVKSQGMQAAFRIQKISMGTYGDGEMYKHSREINEMSKDNLDLVCI